MATPKEVEAIISVGRGLAAKHSAAALAAGLFESLGRHHAPGARRAAWRSILANMIHELLDAGPDRR